MSISNELFNELERLSEESARGRILQATLSPHRSELESLFSKLAAFMRRETQDTFNMWAYTIGDDRITEIKNKTAHILHNVTTGSAIEPEDFETVLNPLYGDVVKIVTPIYSVLSGSEFNKILIKINNSIGNDKWFAWRERANKLGDLLAEINDNDAKICNYEFNDLFFSLAKTVIDTPEIAIESLEEFKKIQNLLETKTPLFEIKASAKKFLTDISSEKSKMEEEIHTFKQLISSEKNELHSEKIKTSYDTLKDNQGEINDLWLRATIMFFVVTCIYVSFLWCNLPKLTCIPYHISTWQFFLYVTPKLALFTLFAAATVWCGKMYKIGKNIEETYTRIAMGINMTIQLTEGDIEQKNKHLPKLIEAFFTLPDSGYITGKDAPSPISQIADLFQNK